MKKLSATFSILLAAALSASAQNVRLPVQAWTGPSAPVAPALPALGSLQSMAPAVPVAALPAASLSALPELPGPMGSGIEDFAEAARAAFGAPATVSKAPVRALAAPTDEEIDANVRRSPAHNPEREKVIKELFVKAGAKPEDIKTQDIGRGNNNIMVVKKGRTDKVIVVGGHHDKVSVGQGTIDNWTGATMVVHLYQLLKDVDTEHTIVFMTFGREEEGLVGSRKYLESLSRQDRAKISAMVNLDTLAVDGTYSWENNSDRSMLDAVAKAARDGGYALTPKYLDGGDADSSSFRDYGIPAITLFGASPETIFDIIHSEDDNPKQFSAAHYKNAYLLSGALIRLLDAQPPKR